MYANSLASVAFISVLPQAGCEAGLNYAPTRKQGRNIERNAALGFQGGNLGEVLLFELGELGFAQLRDQAAKAGIPDHAPPGFSIVERVADVVPVDLHIA